MALITLTEAASRAGVSRSTAERMIVRGEFIAVYRLPSGCMRFDDHELGQWIAACRTKPPIEETAP